MATTKRSTNSNSARAVQAAYSVTDGRDARGVVEVVDGTFVAIDADGNTIGRFDSLRVAARALPGGAP